MRLLMIVIGMLFSLTSFADNFSITTSAFRSHGKIPSLYTCDGKNISPELTFHHVPVAAKSLALVISDPDAVKRIFYHWAVINLPPSMTSLAEKADPTASGAIVLRNTGGKNEYYGPCPPKGQVHTYIFTLYALDGILNLPKETDAKDALGEINRRAIARTDLRGTFSRI